MNIYIYVYKHIYIRFYTYIYVYIDTDGQKNIAVLCEISTFNVKRVRVEHSPQKDLFLSSRAIHTSMGKNRIYIYVYIRIYFYKYNYTDIYIYR
jgi:hypothetical protein